MPDRTDDSGDSPTPGPDADPERPGRHDHRTAADRSGDLSRMASDARDATFGADPGTDAGPDRLPGGQGRARLPGVITGDLGPKGSVAHDMRALSRRERAGRGEVPSGTVVPGGGRFLLAAMLGIALVLLALAILIGWLAS